MIEFHKIVGNPPDVGPGEERIWFTDAGLTFVADNQGHATRMGAGFQQGDAVPVGVPPGSGILYYCISNKKYYLSTPTAWIVLNTEPKAGAGSNSGYAGGVFINDLGNYYTSNEVEGALQEVGAAFPQLMGAKRLPNLTTNVLAFTTAGERRVVAGTLNAPSTVSSWLNQRQDSGGKTFGFAIDEQGKAFTRWGSNFTRLASKAELDSAVATLTGNVNGSIGDVGGYTIKAGPGLIISGDGKISNNPTISLSSNVEGGPFLKEIGGVAIGDLRIVKNTPSLYLDADIIGSSNRQLMRMFNSSTSNKAGLRDDTGNNSFVEYDMIAQSLALNTGKTSTGLNINGRTSIVRSPLQDGENALEVDSLSAIKIASFKNKDGQLNLLSNVGPFNYFQSTNYNNTKPKSLLFGGPHSAKMEDFKVSAHDARFSDRVVAGNGIFVGMDDDHYGKLDFNNKVYIFPYIYRTGQATSIARRHYSHIGYDQNTQTVHIRSFLKDASKPVSSYTEKDLTVSASKFVTRSSEKFKDVIGKFQESGLDIVNGADSWLYKLKNDDFGRTNLGFIIERGVPKIAIEDEGNSIDDYAMLAILWKAVQELSQEVNELKNK